ncbi:MAG: SusC/RagA family TonB-linked outer membrane protein [Bacteroidales bacterium]
MKITTKPNWFLKGRLLSLAKLFLIGIFLLSQFEAYAQQRTITGTVTEGDGTPIPGVSVVIQGTTTGTVTNIDGYYTLPSVPGDAVIEFSFVGMATQQIAVENRTTIDVTMESDAIGLGEVVVIGYGTARREDLTGSISNVRAEEFIKYQPASVSDLLRSSVPGLKVGYATNARATPDFMIRGDNTIKRNADDERAANRPLIVVDGVIFNGDLAEINVNDVESIDVLKDASAASIYGSRASNGVVVISTKKGQSSQPTFRFTANYGVLTSSRRMTTFNGDEAMVWMQDMNESINNELGSEWSRWTRYDQVPDQFKNDWLIANNIAGETDMERITSVWLDNFGFEQNEKENYLAGRSYDWQDWLYQTGQRKDYNFSVSGRGDKITYYWSLGYRDSESLRVGDTFDNVTSRLSLDMEVANFLNVGINANFSFQDEGQNPIPDGGYITASPFDTPWENGMPQTREHLKLAGAGSNRSNPLLDRAYQNRLYNRNRFSPTMYARLNLPFGVKLTTNFTQRLDFRKRFEFNDPNHPLWTHGGEARRRTDETYEWQIDNILSWNGEFGQHRFDVTGLVNAEKNQNWFTDAFARDFSPNSVLGYHELVYGLQPRVDSNDEASTRTALMGRVNYAFNNRYYLSGSIRRDGYSRFGANHLYAVFPSVSTAWTITNESFMAGRPEWLTFLKIRATWGVNGNSSGIGSYAAYARMNDNKYLNYNNGYFFVPYLYVDRMENADLAWEKNTAWNYGLDYGFLGGRLSGAIDVYVSETTDLLLDKQLPIVTGFYSVTTNVGSLKNRGIDLSLNSINFQRNNFDWNTTLNLHYNQNEIVSLTGEKIHATNDAGEPMFDGSGNPVMIEPDDIDNGWFIGQDKDVIWDFEIDGVYQEDEADEAAKYNLYPGDFKVIDQNGDGVLNSRDKVFQGTTSNPWQLSLINSFRYKNFDVGIIFLGKLGYKGGSDLPFNNRQEYIKNHNWYNLPYWTPQNGINDYARINSLRFSGMNIYRDRSYFRFQNFSLGYNLPASMVQSISFNSARLAFNIDNVAVWTNWEQGDPESNFEMPRIFSFSVDFSF